MVFALDDHWIWDFWFAQDADRHHMYFLHAPKSLGDPQLRHRAAKIGHAVSDDLTNWTHLGVALAPGERGAWDDFVTWTGSVIKVGDRWHMYYTGTGSRRGHEIQRIGLAISDDLTTWEKHSNNPVLDLDGPSYERYSAGVWHNQGWRDPWVYPHPDGGFRMLITARSATGRPDERGAIGFATSDDSIRWKAEAPLAEPRIAGDLEVPQLLQIGDWSYLVFCTTRWSARLTARGISGCGTGYLRARQGEPFVWDDSQLLTDSGDGLFGARLVTVGEKLYLMGWQREVAGGAFGGWVSDPIELAATDDGHLRRASVGGSIGNFEGT